MLYREKSNRNVCRYFIALLMPILLIFRTGIAIEQEGRKKIFNARQRYFNGEYLNAINEIISAFEDPTLDAKDTTLAYFLLAFSHIQQGREEKSEDYLIQGKEYFRKIITRNPKEKLPAGFEEFEKEFEEVKREVEEESYCSVTIKSEPRGASVYINDEWKGTTPITLSQLLKNKSYKMSIEKSDYEPESLSLFITKDSTISITLTKIPPSHLEVTPPSTAISQIKPKADIRSYLVAASTGAMLGLTASFLSVHFENQAREKIHSYTIEEDTAKIKKLATQIQQCDFWRSFFYYSSYPLTAIGFYIGLKISEKFIPNYSYLDERSGIKFYCSLDRNLSPKINIKIRRDLW